MFWLKAWFQVEFLFSFYSIYCIFVYEQVFYILILFRAYTMRLISYTWLPIRSPNTIILEKYKWVIWCWHCHLSEGNRAGLSPSYSHFNTVFALSNNTTASTITMPISIIDSGSKSAIDISPHLTEFDWLLRQTYLIDIYDSF